MECGVCVQVSASGEPKSTRPEIGVGRLVIRN